MNEIVISQLEYDEINSVREMQAIVWQDYFLKERRTEVPLLVRSRQNIQYYMEKKPGAFFIAKDRGHIVGSIVCHVWGTVGWFGPFEVRPDYQNMGIGKKLAGTATDFLRSADCGTIGLETMAASTRNVAFYAKLGFRPLQLSYVLHKNLTSVPLKDVRLVPRFISNGDLPEMKRTWAEIHPGLDYSIELESISKYSLGEAVIFEHDNMMAHVFLHTYDLIENNNTALVKLLVSEIRPDESHLQIIDWCERKALDAGKTGLFVRFYTGNGIGLESLLKRGYVLTGTLVRMQSEGNDEKTEMGHVSCWSG